MKDKIMKSRLISVLSRTRLVSYLSNHRLFGKFINYEMISYVICGGLTTVVNYVVYFLMPRFESAFPGLDILLANTVAWIFAVLFAFAVNKAFVFESPAWDKKTLLKELIPFIVCRLLSLGLDNVFVYLTVGLLHMNEFWFKLLSNVFVLFINYFASKYLVFKKNNQKSEEI